MTLPNHQDDTKMTLRIPPKLHREVTMAAERWRREEGVGSVNAWVLGAIRMRLEGGAGWGPAGGRLEVAAGTAEHPAIYKGVGGRMMGAPKKIAEVAAGASIKRDHPVAAVEVLEHAARAEPGFGKSVTEHLPKNGVGGEVSSEEPADEIDFSKVAPSWSSEWERMLLKKETDPDDFYEDIKRMAPGFNPDRNKDFKKMKTISAQVEWLDANHPLGVK